jgi:hypothetical protein
MLLSNRSRWLWIGCAVVVEAAALGGMFFLGTRYGMYHFYRQAATMMESDTAQQKMAGPTTMMAAPMMQNEAFALRGEVMQIDDGQLTVHTKDGTDHVILVDASTRIHGKTLGSDDVHMGDVIFVIGAPGPDGMHAKAVAIVGQNSMDDSMTDEFYENQEEY